MSHDLSAVVLAGVHDWGACLLNQATLRPLVPIANRPVIEHVLSALTGVGVTRAIICTNGEGGRMREVLGDFFVGGLPLSYRDDPMPRGPAGCIKDAAATLDDFDVIAIEGSMLPFFDLEALVDHHRSADAALTIAAARRPSSALDTFTPVGAYVVSSTALAHVPDRGFCDIKEGLLPKLHQAGHQVDVHTIDGIAPNLQGMSSYFALNDWAIRLADNGGWNLDGYAREGDAITHIDARIDDSVRLLGPVIIGPGVRLGRGAIVVGPTAIGRDSDIGAYTVVSRSAVWDRARVDDHAQIDRCVVATGGRVAEHAELFHTVCLTGGRVLREPGGSLASDDTNGDLRVPSAAPTCMCPMPPAVS